VRAELVREVPACPRSFESIRLQLHGRPDYDHAAADLVHVSGTAARGREGPMGWWGDNKKPTGVAYPQSVTFHCQIPFDDVWIPEPSLRSIVGGEKVEVWALRQIMGKKMGGEKIKNKQNETNSSERLLRLRLSRQSHASCL